MSTAPKLMPVKVLSSSGDAGLRASRELLLRQHGCSVTTSLSKAHAIELIRFHPFDLLILGNSLSQNTCMELGRLFREYNPRGRIIEIVALRGDSPKNQPDETVVGLDGPEALLKTIAAAQGSSR